MTCAPGPLADADAALVDRARRGDRAAFDSLVVTHLPMVWRVAHRIVRRRADAEDVAQETFLAAWRGLPSFRGAARFSTWLHHIAVSRAINHLNRAAERTSRAAHSLDAEEGAPALEATLARGANPGPPSPLAALEAEELRRRLAACLDQLPAAWRAVLALRDGEGLSYEQAAAAAGIALGTVRSRLARARLALRACIEGARP